MSDKIIIRGINGSTVDEIDTDAPLPTCEQCEVCGNWGKSTDMDKTASGYAHKTCEEYATE